MLRSFLVLVFVICSISSAFCQKKIPVIHATNPRVSIRDGANLYPGAWNISAELKPDVFETNVKDQKRVAFITDKDSVSFNIEPDKTYDFVIILNGKDSAYTQIKAIRFIEPAVFTKDYIKSHDNKTFVEIPEVYELVNIIFAITNKGKTDEDIVERETPYYREVIAKFDAYKNEPVVLAINKLLEQNRYFVLKMDAYGFDLDANDKLVQSKIYDRVSWGTNNTILPFVPELNDFVAKTGFVKFYQQHQTLYSKQLICYRDSLQTGEMQKWLNRNFPDTRYNSFKIIFSPLVSGNQSANWFGNNGFKEAQAHVNFPYSNGNWLKGLSPAAILIKKGNIVFTELNHAFINPEGEKKIYQNDVSIAFKDLSHWATPGKAASHYDNAYQCFNEYMNWALVSLRYIDYAPPAEADNLIHQNESYMTEGRGFTKFREFDNFLVKLYKAKNKNETVADLYPKIVAWFKAN